MEPRREDLDSRLGRLLRQGTGLPGLCSGDLGQGDHFLEGGIKHRSHYQEDIGQPSGFQEKRGLFQESSPRCFQEELGQFREDLDTRLGRMLRQGEVPGLAKHLGEEELEDGEIPEEFGELEKYPKYPKYPKYRNYTEEEIPWKEEAPRPAECRNGSGCWFLAQGRCRYLHPAPSLLQAGTTYRAHREARAGRAGEGEGPGLGPALKARAGPVRSTALNVRPGLGRTLRARTCSTGRREELARRWADRLGPRAVTAIRTWVKRQLVERLVMDAQSRLAEE
jgi:hypothetical protein